MLRLLLLLTVLAFQDDEAERLIRQLGDSDPALREQATVSLAARGEAARETLTRGRDNPDPEIRSRCATLLLRMDQAITLGGLEKAQRPLKLKLLAADVKELQGGMAVTDGALFSFQRRPWAPKGVVLGTIFETTIDPKLQGEIEWSVGAVRGGKEVSVETCSYHSPRLVYVPGAPPAEAAVTLKGTRRWYCDVPVEFKNPEEGLTRRVGPFSVTVQWPSIAIHSDKDLSDAVLRQVLKDADIRCTLKENRGTGGGGRFTCVRGCGLRPAPRTPSWCGCDVKPAKIERDPPSTFQDLLVPSTSWGKYSLDDFESISLTVHKPVEEPFEVTSPALR
jgi:hypothetical protein